MKILVACYTLMILISLPNLASAQIYKKTLPNGDVVFTDQADQNAKKIELEPTTVIPSLQVPPPKLKTSNKTKAKKPTITIKSPGNGITYRNDQANGIPLEVQIRPEPAMNDEIIATINGQATDLKLPKLQSLDRGEHILVVRIKNAQGKTITSNSSTFYVQRFSQLQPEANNPYADPEPKP